MAAVPKNDFCINFYYKKKLRFFGVLFEHKRGGRRDVRTHKPFFTIINRFLLIRKAGERLQNKGMRDSSIHRILLILSPSKLSFCHLPRQGGLSALSAVMERKAALYPILAAYSTSRPLLGRDGERKRHGKRELQRFPIRTLRGWLIRGAGKAGES